MVNMTFNSKGGLHTTMMAILPPTSPTTVIGGFSLGISTGQKKYTHTNFHIKKSMSHDKKTQETRNKRELTQPD